MTRLVLLLAIATSACVKQGAVKTIEPAPAHDDISSQVCNDPHFSLSCTPKLEPQSKPRPTRVDTNFAFPQRSSFAGG